MKNILFTLFFCLDVLICLGQKLDNIWNLGRSHLYLDSIRVLNFDSQGDTSHLMKGYMSTRSANASICDSLGNLLFYSNGIYIADSSHQMVPNSDSLNPGWVANSWHQYGYPIFESMLILPTPQKDSLYYLFHISYDSTGLYWDRLYYTSINRNLNNGKGAVVAKNQTLIKDTIFNNLEAMKHANGEDWWILFPKSYDNVFYRFLVTQDSILGPFSQRIGNASYGNDYSQAAFSPDGTKYACYDRLNDLDIYDFDRCTGLLYNYQHVIIQDTSDYPSGLPVAGLAFSPNSRYLYVNSAGIYVYQFDVLAANITASMDTVAVFDGYYTITPSNLAAFWLGQLAPNGKIYFNCVGNVDALHVIHSPDSAGVACNFEQHSIPLPHSSSTTLPNFPHYRTPALSTPCDTMTAVVVLVEQQEEQVKLYPNPANQVLHVEGTKMLDKIVLYNTLGQEVYQKAGIYDLMVTIPIARLENGVYFVAIWIDGQVINKEIQVMR